jgi:hypothetical protein
VPGGASGTDDRRSGDGRQSRYLTSLGRTYCLRLPPPTEDAWNWQLRGSCLGHPLEVFFPDDHARSSLRRREVPRSRAEDSRAPRACATLSAVCRPGLCDPVAASADPTPCRSISLVSSGPVGDRCLMRSEQRWQLTPRAQRVRRRRPHGRHCESVCSVAFHRRADIEHRDMDVNRWGTVVSGRKARQSNGHRAGADGEAAVAARDR